MRKGASQWTTAARDPAKTDTQVGCGPATQVGCERDTKVVGRPGALSSPRGGWRGRPVKGKERPARWRERAARQGQAAPREVAGEGHAEGASSPPRGGWRGRPVRGKQPPARWRERAAGQWQAAPREVAGEGHAEGGGQQRQRRLPQTSAAAAVLSVWQAATALPLIDKVNEWKMVNETSKSTDQEPTLPNNVRR